MYNITALGYTNKRKKQITNMSYDPQNQRMSPEAIIKKAIVGNVEARVFMVMV